MLIKRKFQSLTMIEYLKKIGKSLSLILALFFSSGLEPWSVKITRKNGHIENENVDILFDMAPFYEESLESKKPMEN